MPNTTSRVLCIIAKLMPPGLAATPESDLRNDLHFDCIDRAEIAVGIEDQFGFLIPDHALETAETVQDLVSAVEAGLLARAV